MLYCTYILGATKESLKSVGKLLFGTGPLVVPVVGLFVLVLVVNLLEVVNGGLLVVFGTTPLGLNGGGGLLLGGGGLLLCRNVEAV